MLSLNRLGFQLCLKWRQHLLDEGEEILDELLDLPTALEITQRLESRMASLFPDLFGEPAL